MTRHRPGPFPRRPRWRPGRHVPLDERIATDPDRVVQHIAQLVASELRATGQAVTIPAAQQTLRDRLTPRTARGAIVLGVASGVAAAVLVLAAIGLLVWGLTS